MNIIYWLIFATIIAIIPVFLIKKYIQTQKTYYLLITLLLYIILIKAYINIFSQKNISTIYTLLQITQILLIVIGGITLFNESITYKKIIGIIFGILCIYFIYE